MAESSGEQGKVVAITGCTRGIGRGLLEWFAKAGHRVAGCGTSDSELEATRNLFPSALVSKADVRDVDSVRTWTSAVKSKFGHIDLLICNAGISPAQGSVWEISPDEWQRACDINIHGTTRVLQNSVPLLRAPGALVVLMGSRYGRSVVQGQGCYAATKWATEALAKTLALELRDKGVAVVSLDPGVVNTEMLHRSCPGGTDWCNQQRSPTDFAAEVGPFLLSLGLADTGRSLTAPGSPPHYFQTGVPYKDRPAWANGIGPFVRACDDVSAEPSCQEAGRKKQRLLNGPRRFFISGVMLGSKQKLDNADKDLASQNYRQQIADVIKRAEPDAIIIEPLDHVKAHAARLGKTLEELNTDALVREAFLDVVALVKDCDIIISNLPEASMGSAIELWEARKAGLAIMTISPMTGNWTIRSVTDHNFTDLQDFEENFAKILPAAKRTI